MRATAAIFPSTERAAEVAEQLGAHLGKHRVLLFTPGTGAAQLERLPVTEDMPPVGGPQAAIVLGAVATAWGLFFAGGLGWALVLGIVAASAGWWLGRRLDQGLYAGLPADEVFVYRQALEQGRSLVVALVRHPREDAAARRHFQNAEAEAIDQARQAWWLGLRAAEEAAYEGGPAQFAQDETAFRQGFEAALRGRPRTLTAPAAFQRGHARGLLYRTRR